MATKIIYKKKTNGETSKVPEKVKITIYSGKDSDGSGRQRTKTVRIPEKIDGKKQLADFCNAEEERFKTEIEQEKDNSLEEEKKKQEAAEIERLVEERVAQRLAEERKKRGETMIGFPELVRRYKSYSKSKPKSIKESTYRGYDGIYPRLTKFFGNAMVDEITTVKVDEFFSAISHIDSDSEKEKSLSYLRNKKDGKVLKPKTIREHRNILKRLFEYARHCKLIKENPVDDFDRAASLNDEGGEEEKCLQPKDIVELERIMKSQKPIWRAMLGAYLGTGCRRGEIAGLKKANIDWEHGTAKIDCNLLSGRVSVLDENGNVMLDENGEAITKPGVYEDSTKTYKSKRTVALSPFVIELMRKYEAEREERKAKLGNMWVAVFVKIVVSDSSIIC